MKLLIFTEHKDTLDYLAGDGKDGRPLGKLREWGLKVTQIHGGMKIGDRDTPGTRIYAEREFREDAQVLVATEAAGEGINLQFCWLMINYDIPWNPVRLEQRMGRIHRYGQEHDCLIFNFVAVNTREGRVLQKLLERLREIRQRTGHRPGFRRGRRGLPRQPAGKALPRDVRPPDRPAATSRRASSATWNRSASAEITESTLEGLAKRELNLACDRRQVGRGPRAAPDPRSDRGFLHRPRVQSRESIRDQCRRTGTSTASARCRVRFSRSASGWSRRFGRLGREYQKIVFDKALLPADPTLEWVTPGHPLFEAVRDDVGDRVTDDLRRGAVFYDLHAKAPYRLDVFAASIKDGRANTLHRRLFIVEDDVRWAITIRQPTLLLDVSPAPKGTPVPNDDQSA